MRSALAPVIYAGSVSSQIDADERFLPSSELGLASCHTRIHQYDLCIREQSVLLTEKKVN